MASQKNLPNIVLLVIFLVILVGGLFTKLSLTLPQKKSSLSDAGTASPTATASALPVATATPSAEPVLTGFCLNVPILMYHHIYPLGEAEQRGIKNLTVDPQYFEHDLEYLNAHGYRTLSVVELVNALNSHQKLEGKTAVLTFDDAYDDIYTYAYPLAQKYRITLNLMVPTGLMENSGYLTWNQLKDMVGSGIVYAYNHTWSHSALAGDDDQKITSEYKTAQQQLTDHLGSVPTIIVYPYDSYNNRVVSVLKTIGATAGLSTNPGTWQCDSFLMGLHRTRIGNSPLSAYGL
jgi:peptidoglycan/xylan/chitin deacetylase (PgdA/CDA1 family)